MKKLFFAALILLGANTFAEWTENMVVLDVSNVTKPDEIATTLQYLKDFQNYLVSLDLASPSKLTIKSISAHVSYYKWTNDNECQATEPVEDQRIEIAKATYYYAADPSNEFITGSENGLGSPCNGLKKTTSFH